MIPFADPEVKAVFEQYPDEVREKMNALRDLIYSKAEQIGQLASLEESLKWGEPAWCCKTGTTVRIDWKADDPDHYRMFFHCQTALIPTFRKVFSDCFDFEGNRAIRFSSKLDPDLVQLGECVEVALKYKQVKDRHLLGLNL